MKYYFILILCIMFFSLQAIPVLLQSEKQQYWNMLETKQFDSTSVNFLKDWSSDTDFKLPVVLDILSHPFHYPDLVEHLTEVLPSDSMMTYQSFLQGLLQSGDTDYNYSTHYDTYFKTHVRKPKDLFEYTQTVFHDASIPYLKALSGLSSRELKELYYLSFTMWQESEDSKRYEDFFQATGVDTFPNLKPDDMKALFHKLDLGSLYQANEIMTAGFHVLEDHISDLHFNSHDLLIRKTPWGNFAIGSTGNDQYEGDFALIVDPAGNDIYRCKIRTTYTNPFYWVLDISGDDQYIQSTPYSLFSVFAGCGLHADWDGNDDYRGNDGTFSSFYGYQFHEDKAGNDNYRAGTYCLGSSTLGMSFLRDDAGNDIYSVTSNGEGFGGTYGIGCMIDLAGHDMYYAGGDYMHAPLAPFDQRTTSQGFGFGVRPELGGGIGIIYDGGGNDAYHGGVYAQGVAYWYALGILIDKSGNDSYDAVYYPQGSGIHLAAGFLFDGAGEDHYYSKHGPGQGAAHDFGVGFFIDREGDDAYSVEGGYGLGLSNSVGVFLDVSGNDRYERNNDSSYGFANESRDSGGLGLFLDTGGKDFYANKFCANDSLWQRGIYGFGKDIDLVKPAQTVLQQSNETEAATVDSTASIQDLFAAASEWEVGNAQMKVQKAREYLMKKQQETAAYIYKNKLNSKDGLTYRAISWFAEKSPELRKFFPQALTNEDSLIVKNTISLIGELQDSTYVKQFRDLLKQRKYVPSILSALGDINTNTSIDILCNYMKSPVEKERIIVARGLKSIGTTRAREKLASMRKDPSFLIQTIIRLQEQKNP